MLACLCIALGTARTYLRFRPANKRWRSRQAGAAGIRCGMYHSYTAVLNARSAPTWPVARYVLLAALSSGVIPDN
ncbi:hypothetical protein XFF6991_150419 [Xanthomonas phaseoli pv. phaseoli]|uniref:Uncharacterized protein n=1 Tax=Xanthomonas campestris pv. phaseoli TaxID=317013 RepID=A0A7Z7IW25_XANCH|nr:hypothetical protein XFF6991_150419 [Xanthomonas phaseoli pv. phaseoli]